MAEETDDDEMTTEGGESETMTESGEETEPGDSGLLGTNEVPPPPPTELHNATLFMSKYLDQKLDKLFAAAEKITTDMAEMEKRIMTSFENTMKIEHDAVYLKLQILENQLNDQGKMIRDGDYKASQQANQLDELQNQEGAETRSESQAGTEEGTDSEAGTESEAQSETGGETTDGDETEADEEEEE